MSLENTEHAQWIRSALTEHEGRLLRYAERLFRGDLERARDAVQDTFLRLCRQDRERVEGHVTQWLFTVCRNRILEILRKEKRMSPLTDERLAVEPVRTPGPADAVVHRDDLANMASLLLTLPDRQQEVIRLKFQSDLSYKDISSVMELSVSNVGFLIHTGIQTLRRRLKEQDAARKEA